MSEPRALVGLIGANILQSLSPALHEDAFAAAGIRGAYHLMDTDVLGGRGPADLVAAARTVGFLGVNVTFPFKEAVVPLLDALSPEAAQIGAVNTVVIGRDGRMTGHNTDRIGFRRSFEENIGAAAVAGKTALLVGAGGAGRAVAFALMDLGVGTLMVHDQDGGPRRRARRQSRHALRPASARASPAIRPPRWRTPRGWRMPRRSACAAFPATRCPWRRSNAHHWVADVIYTPLETELVVAARAKGARAFGGGGMCVHQAAAAFQLFTGLAPDVARMHRVFARRQRPPAIARLK